MRKGRLAGTSQKAPVSLAGKIETED
jgi:hypothetical protein